MLDLIRDLAIENATKIVLLVADGLGGLPMEPGGPTELEAASTPHLDALVAANVCGLSIPVAPGITPGSGPGHLGLFGYDPLRYSIGRGVLEALGIDFDLRPADVAARGNFCTVGPDGAITDRRAGRISTDVCRVSWTSCERSAWRGSSYSWSRCATTGSCSSSAATASGRRSTTPIPGVPASRRSSPRRDAGSERTAALLREFIERAAAILEDEHPANMITLRGIARRPPMPAFDEVYKLRAAAIAVYPMYRGLARLVGMTILPAGGSWAEQVDRLHGSWRDYDFFFLHYKYTDAAGEDGDFARKVACIEEFDAQIGRVMELRPEVVIVTGDHSTPASWRSHSWHPVPVALAARSCRPDAATRFGENECLRGGLGQIEAKYLLPLALAHAGRLGKYGA